jgi:hypothetical protein
MTIIDIAKQSLRAVITAALLVAVASRSPSHAAAASDAGFTAQSRQVWQRLSAGEDNFSVLIPVQPEIRGRGGVYLGALRRAG